MPQLPSKFPSVSMSSNQRLRGPSGRSGKAWNRALPALTQPALLALIPLPWPEPVSDINTGMVDSLKALDHKRPIREADIELLNLGLGAAETWAKLYGWILPGALVRCPAFG
jgi:hypothetical protein